MNEYWEKFSHFVDSKTLRERVILLLVAIVLVYGLADLLFLGTLLDKSQMQGSKLASIEQANRKSKQQIEQLVAVLGIEQSSGSEKKRKLLERLERIDEAMAQAADGFVPATQMPAVLEEVLDSSKNLSLLKLENKPVELVSGAGDSGASGEADSGAQASSSGNNLYRHGVEMQLEGSYLASLDYLRRLEKLAWRFQWSALSFEVKEYPAGVLTLEIYTFSTERDWIGV